MTTCKDPIRLALLGDYREENWPSMDICADRLAQALQTEQTEHFKARLIRPAFHYRFSRLPLIGRRKRGFNGDRLLNRFWDYPRQLRQIASNFQLFHICDHSYAHLVHELPPESTGVYCHDLDAFRCLLEPALEVRPAWFRAMSRRILQGLQTAAIVFHSTAAIGDRIRAYDLVDPNRLVQAPYGVEPIFCPQASPTVSPTLQTVMHHPFLLHVGSCIPRKRIDLLLEIFSLLRSRHPDLHLVKVGGDWSQEHRAQIDRWGLQPVLHHFQGLDRADIAALYRQATLVLMPSEAEGFGLPIIEGLACGTGVVASDLPVLREVGGDAVVYCPVGEVITWVETIDDLLNHPSEVPPQEKRLAQASRYSWSTHAATIAQAYTQLHPQTTP